MAHSASTCRDNRPSWCKTWRTSSGSSTKPRTIASTNFQVDGSLKLLGVENVLMKKFIYVIRRGKEGEEREGRRRSDDRGRAGSTTLPSSLLVEVRHRQRAAATVCLSSTATAASVPPPLSPRLAAGLLSLAAAINIAKCVEEVIFMSLGPGSPHSFLEL